MNNRGRDPNPPLTLPEFKTLKKQNYQISKVENIKITSVEIYFTLDKKDQAGNVVIKDKIKEPTEIKNNHFR